MTGYSVFRFLYTTATFSQSNQTFATGNLNDFNPDNTSTLAIRQKQIHPSFPHINFYMFKKDFVWKCSVAKLRIGLIQQYLLVWNSNLKANEASSVLHDLFEN